MFGRKGRAQRKTESTLHLAAGKRSKIKISCTSEDGRQNYLYWRSFNLYCMVIWNILEEADEEYRVTKASPHQQLIALEQSSQNPIQTALTVAVFTFLFPEA